MPPAVPTTYTNPTGLQNAMTSVCKWMQANIPASGFAYQFLSQLQGIKPPYVSVTDFSLPQPGNTAYGKEINPDAPNGQQQTGRESNAMLEINIRTDITIDGNAVENLRKIRDRIIYGLTNAGVPNDIDNSIPVPAISLLNYSAAGQAIKQETISQATFSVQVFSWAHQTITTASGALVVQIMTLGDNPASVTYNGLPLTEKAFQSNGSFSLSTWVLFDPPTGTFNVEVDTGGDVSAVATATSYANVSSTDGAVDSNLTGNNPESASVLTTAINSRLCIMAAQDMASSTITATGYTASSNGYQGNLSAQVGFKDAGPVDTYTASAFFSAGNSHQGVQALELIQQAAPQPTGQIITVPGTDNAIISRYYAPNEDEPNVHRYQLLVKICWYEMAN